MLTCLNDVGIFKCVLIIEERKMQIKHMPFYLAIGLLLSASPVVIFGKTSALRDAVQLKENM